MHASWGQARNLAAVPAKHIGSKDESKRDFRHADALQFARAASSSTAALYINKYHQPTSLPKRRSCMCGSCPAHSRGRMHVKRFFMNAIGSWTCLRRCCQRMKGQFYLMSNTHSPVDARSFRSTTSLTGMTLPFPATRLSHGLLTRCC